MQKRNTASPFSMCFCSSGVNHMFARNESSLKWLTTTWDCFSLTDPLLGLSFSCLKKVATQDLPQLQSCLLKQVLPDDCSICLTTPCVWKLLIRVGQVSNLQILAPNLGGIVYRVNRSQFALIMPPNCRQKGVGCMSESVRKAYRAAGHLWVCNPPSLIETRFRFN